MNSLLRLGKNRWNFSARNTYSVLEESNMTSFSVKKFASWKETEIDVFHNIMTSPKAFNISPKKASKRSSASQFAVPIHVQYLHHNNPPKWPYVTRYLPKLHSRHIQTKALEAHIALYVYVHKDIRGLHCCRKMSQANRLWAHHI